MTDLQHNNILPFVTDNSTADSTEIFLNTEKHYFQGSSSDTISTEEILLNSIEEDRSLEQAKEVQHDGITSAEYAVYLECCKRG